MAAGDTAFVGSIPAVYEELLVPMIFAEPARRLADAIAAAEPGEILETAAGTGVLTRALVERTAATITATDLNAPMLQEAASLCASDRVTWKVADATELEYPDAAFDAVACQFGVMFFPDKPKGHAEALRVLRPGGTLFFNAWDRIEANPAWRVVSDALVDASPEEPLHFLRRAPYSYFEPEVIEADLRKAGCDEIVVEAMTGTSRSSVEETARAICQGTPLRMAIEAHGSMTVEVATALAAKALRDEFGDGSFDAPIGWLQVSARSIS